MTSEVAKDEQTTAAAEAAESERGLFDFRSALRKTNFTELNGLVESARNSDGDGIQQVDFRSVLKRKPTS